MAKAPVTAAEKCKVRSEWFKKLDSNGMPFGRWLIRVPGSNSRVSCTICNSQLNCEFKGFQAITQHSQSSKHKKNAKSHSTQLIMTADDTANKTSVLNDTIEIIRDQRPSPVLQLTDRRDEATKAEIIWAMKNVSSNYSGKSCDDLGQTFQKMFPNEPTCKDFSLASSKLSYIVSD